MGDRGRTAIPIGAVVVTATDNPAAGAEIAAITVPTNALWKPILFTISVVVGAAAYDPTLRIRNAGDTAIAVLPMSGSPTATATELLTWGVGLDSRDNASNRMQAPLPADLYLPEGFDIITGDITADDDYGVGQLTVLEWFVE